MAERLSTILRALAYLLIIAAQFALIYLVIALSPLAAGTNDTHSKVTSSRLISFMKEYEGEELHEGDIVEVKNYSDVTTKYSFRTPTPSLLWGVYEITYRSKAQNACCVVTGDVQYGDQLTFADTSLAFSGFYYPVSHSGIEGTAPVKFITSKEQGFIPMPGYIVEKFPKKVASDFSDMFFSE